MFSGDSRRSVATLLFLAAVRLCAGDPTYRSVSIDGNGQLHIVLTSGSTILPAKIEGQQAFSEARISTDFRTVGWLVEYPEPALNGAVNRNQLLSGTLALYRAGRILHLFTTDQVFWDWRFEAGGKRVAYSTGPTHGGAGECVLRDVDTGRIVARWPVDPDKDPPPWARGLHM